MTENDTRTLHDFMPGSVPEDGVARAGTPLAGRAEKASREAIEEALRGVYDPEISVNIYDLGLIYRLEQDEEGNVSIDMTLTSPMCPVAGTLPQEVANAAAALDGVGRVQVRLVWDPPWSREMMSEEARLALDLF